MSYTATGPFVNGSSPGISSQFLNNVEAALVALNSAASDPVISSDGAGNETVTSVSANKMQLSGAGAFFGLLAGTLSRIAFFNGTGSGTFTHNLNATPSLIIIMYAGSGTAFGSPPTHPAYYYNATTTTCQVVADSGYSWLAVALHS